MRLTAKAIGGMAAWRGGVGIDGMAPACSKPA
jgi:hypothetical protein